MRAVATGSPTLLSGRFRACAPHLPDSTCGVSLHNGFGLPLIIKLTVVGASDLDAHVVAMIQRRCRQGVAGLRKRRHR